MSFSPQNPSQHFSPRGSFELNAPGLQHDPLLVPQGGLLRGAGPGLRRRQRRRLGRLPRPDRQTGLPAVARGGLPLAPAVLPVTAARRRLRHLGLQLRAGRVRHHQRLQAARGRGPCPGRPGHHRPAAEPHLRPAPLVPGVAQGPGRSVRRLLRLERHGREVRRRPHHLRGHRGIQLDLRPDPPAVLLAPVLQPPARPELREPQGH